MTETFNLTVNYKGEDRDFETELQAWGYAHRFLVKVEGIDVFFERDEEGHYRAVIPPAHLNTSSKPIDRTLLQVIATTLETALT